MIKSLKLGQILILPFDKGWKFFLANFVVAIMVSVFFFNNSFNSIESLLISIGWGMLISISQWSGHVYIHCAIDQKISILKHPTKHTVWNVILKVIYAFMAYLTVQSIMISLVNGSIITGRHFNSLVNGSYFPIFVAMGISLVFSARGYFYAWRDGVLQIEKLKSEMLAYKYESLRNQINPHFLFNSFNVLSDLIYSDQKQAVDFVQKLSGLFRYVLDSRDKELVSLKEELHFIESFISLLQTRFGDKLIIENELVADEDDLIVPMSLQLLIENAVKHNEISKAHPLRISLTKNDDHLEVWNTLRLKSIGDTSKKLGLKNIEQQYSYFTDKGVIIEHNKNEFSVKLPLLKAVKQ